MDFKEKALDSLNDIIKSYTKMIEEVIVAKGEKFDSGPYAKAIDGMVKLIGTPDEKND